MFSDLIVKPTEEEMRVILDNKEKFDSYLTGTGRFGIDGLINHLESIGFYTAPASTRYHMARDGGLLEHSLNVIRIALDLAESLNVRTGMGADILPRESVVLSAALHDVGKAGYYNEPYYVENILKNGNRGATPYSKGPVLSIPHEVVSVQTVSHFIELTGEESYAIYHHNGMYGDMKYALQGKERPLQTLIHMADMWASRFVEQPIPEPVDMAKY